MSEPQGRFQELPEQSMNQPPADTAHVAYR